MSLEDALNNTGFKSGRSKVKMSDDIAAKLEELEQKQVADLEEVKKQIQKAHDKLFRVDVWKGDHESHIKRINRLIDRWDKQEKAKRKKETQEEADLVNMIMESTVDTPIEQKDVFSPRLADQKVLPSLKHLHHTSPQGP